MLKFVRTSTYIYEYTYTKTYSTCSCLTEIIETWVGFFPVANRVKGKINCILAFTFSQIE